MDILYCNRVIYFYVCYEIHLLMTNFQHIVLSSRKQSIHKYCIILATKICIDIILVSW